jgi:hypothetical protein
VSGMDGMPVSRDTIVDAKAIRGLGRDVGAMRGMGRGTNVVRGVTIVFEVHAT